MGEAQDRRQVLDFCQAHTEPATKAAPHGQASTNPNGPGDEIAQPKSRTRAKDRRADQSDGPRDGTPGNNQAQNKQFRDATRGLSKSQKRQVHDAITGQNMSFHEIKEIADIVRRGGRP